MDNELISLRHELKVLTEARKQHEITRLMEVQEKSRNISVGQSETTAVLSKRTPDLNGGEVSMKTEVKHEVFTFSDRVVIFVGLSQL